MPQLYESNLSEGGKVFKEFLSNRQAANGNEQALERKALLKYYKSHFDHMEADHGFIQWLFPITTVGVNRQAPVLKSDDYTELLKNKNTQLRMIKHFRLFLSFLGLKQNADHTIIKENATQWNKWVESSHNNLRITRVLTSMNAFGLREKYATPLLELLEQSKGEEMGPYLPLRNHDQALEYWRNALEQTKVPSTNTKQKKPLKPLRHLYSDSSSSSEEKNHILNLSTPPSYPQVRSSSTDEKQSTYKQSSVASRMPNPYPTPQSYKSSYVFPPQSSYYSSYHAPSPSDASTVKTNTKGSSNRHVNPYKLKEQDESGLHQVNANRGKDKDKTSSQASRGIQPGIKSKYHGIN